MYRRCVSSNNLNTLPKLQNGNPPKHIRVDWISVIQYFTVRLMANIRPMRVTQNDFQHTTKLRAHTSCQTLELHLEYTLIRHTIKLGSEHVIVLLSLLFCHIAPGGIHLRGRTRKIKKGYDKTDISSSCFLLVSCLSVFVISCTYICKWSPFDIRNTFHHVSWPQNINLQVHFPE